MKDELDIDDDEIMEDSSENEIVSLLKRMSQKLTFLENKIDQLVSQSQERPFENRRSPNQYFPKRPSSRPPRPYERTDRYPRGDRDRAPRDRDSAPGHYYERGKPDKKRSPVARKKPFFSHRKDRD